MPRDLILGASPGVKHRKLHVEPQLKIFGTSQCTGGEFAQESNSRGHGQQALDSWNL